MENLQNDTRKDKKKSLREELLKSVPEALSPDFTLFQKRRAKISRKICAQLFACPEWQDAGTVFCYVGTERELDTTEILLTALGSGKRLAVPKVEGKGVMTAREIRGLNELVSGAMGIPEPAEYTPVIAKEDIDLVIVPGIAFDKTGYRLGYGGGYYDRYLSGLSLSTIGLCPESRLLSDIPRETHDQAVQIMITEARIIRVHRPHSNIGGM